MSPPPFSFSPCLPSYPPTLPREFITKIAPRLAYANPAVAFTMAHRPTPSTRAKDPALQKRAELAAEEIKREGMEPSLMVEFGE